jgi:hypothetical protein
MLDGRRLRVGGITCVCSNAKHIGVISYYTDCYPASILTSVNFLGLADHLLLCVRPAKHGGDVDCSGQKH